MLVKESEYIDKTSVLLLCKRVITSERLLESFWATHNIETIPLRYCETEAPDRKQ